MEEVERSLVVIEKLRQYRPKPQPRPPSFPQSLRPKSGARTPIFGLSSPQLTDKQHFSLLSRALRQAKGSTPGGAGESEGEEDERTHLQNDRSAASDQEDSIRMRQRASVSLNRLSWQNSGEGHFSPPTPPTHSRVPSQLYEMTEVVTAPGMKEGGTAVELETLPSSPSLGQVYAPATVSANAPALSPSAHRKTGSYPLQAQNSQGTYASSPKGSLDDPFYSPSGGNTASGSASPGGLAGAAEAAVAGAAVAAEAVDATLRQTVKVLKTAVLHDARNIKGGAGDSGTLGWNVNSAHEAKVGSIFPILIKESDQRRVVCIAPRPLDLHSLPSPRTVLAHPR